LSLAEYKDEIVLLFYWFIV